MTRGALGEAGFTLVETLVSFAVLALILTVLLGGLSRMTTGGRHAETLRVGLMLAQAKLDGIGITEPLPTGESAGRFDNGFAWRIRAGDVLQPDARPRGAWIEVTVFAGATAAAPAVSLATFKLKEVPRP